MCVCFVCNEQQNSKTHLGKVIAAVRAGDEEGEGVDEAHAGLLRLRRGLLGEELGEAMQCSPGVGPEDAGVPCGWVGGFVHGFL